MEKVRAQGHEITYDWTQNGPTPPDGVSLEDYLADCALKDMEGVQAADMLVLLLHPRAQGSYVELGIALGEGLPVIVVDSNLAGILNPETPCVFLNLPEVKHAKDEGQVLEWLGSEVDPWAYDWDEPEVVDREYLDDADAAFRDDLAHGRDDL